MDAQGRCYKKKELVLVHYISVDRKNDVHVHVTLLMYWCNLQEYRWPK